MSKANLGYRSPLKWPTRRDLGYQDAVYWSRFGQGQYTEAEAICKAALLSNLSGKAECTQ